MDEIIQKIVASEFLSEDVKTEISTALKQLTEQHMQAVRDEVTMQVRAELREQWDKDQATLVESLDEFLTEQVAKELAQFSADVERFRDLEAESAAQIIESKQQLREQFDSELESLVDNLSVFLEERIAFEMDEFKEDIELVRENSFGRRVYEAFAQEFNTYNKSSKNTIEAELSVAESKLQDAQAKIAMLEESAKSVAREAKLEKVLAPLSGAKREQMKFILESIPTDRLESAYATFIGRVLKEENTPAKVVESAPAAPAAKQATVVESGDAKVIVESVQQATKPSAASDELRRLAGISNSK